MEAVSGLLHGFAVALTPANILWCFVGCFLGTVVGILPGLGPAATIAMLLPLTYNMNPAGGIIMLSGIYYGAKYGGSGAPARRSASRRSRRSLPAPSAWSR